MWPNQSATRCHIAAATIGQSGGKIRWHQVAIGSGKGKVGPRERRFGAVLCGSKAGKRGLVLLSCGVYANVIRILVPITASDALLDEGLAIMGEALKAAKG